MTIPRKRADRLGPSLRVLEPLAKSCSGFALLLGGGDFGGCVGIFLGEAFHAAGGVDKLLLAGEEGVAIGADFHVELFTLDGGAGREIVAAGAVHGYGVIVGVDTGFHGKTPFCRVRSARHSQRWEDTAASLGREQAFDYTIRRKDSPTHWRAEPKIDLLGDRR